MYEANEEPQHAMCSSLMNHPCHLLVKQFFPGVKFSCKCADMCLSDFKFQGLEYQYTHKKCVERAAVKVALKLRRSNVTAAE